MYALPTPAPLRPFGSSLLCPHLSILCKPSLPPNLHFLTPSISLPPSWSSCFLDLPLPESLPSRPPMIRDRQTHAKTSPELMRSWHETIASPQCQKISPPLGTPNLSSGGRATCLIPFSSSGSFTQLHPPVVIFYNRMLQMSVCSFQNSRSREDVGILMTT